jgi:SNF2 family DNA or RNA helicase
MQMVIPDLLRFKHSSLTVQQAKLKIQSEHLLLQRGFDRLICLNQIHVKPEQWQIESAIVTLRDMHGSVILADEVGLGKTIEAGLILKELLCRGLIRSVLILVPASLVEQWKTEMKEKFEINLTDTRENGWEEQQIIISSISMAVRSKEKQTKLTNRSFDLIIVDEAHSLKDHNTETYKFVYGLKRKNTILMTATPIQNNILELYNLVNITKPGYLKSRKYFRKEYMLNRFTPKNVESLKKLLSEVMIRHRRSNTLVHLPRRRMHTIPIELTTNERLFYNGVIDFCRSIYQKYLDGMVPIGINHTQTHLIVLILLSLLKQNCSSPQSTVLTLQNKILPRLVEKNDIHICRSLIELGRKIVVPTKVIALVDAIGSTDEQCIVYSEYLATMHLLQRCIESSGKKVILFHGGMSAKEKSIAIQRFANKEANVFLSTESGGQGLNLQYCHRVFNYDLPWNPARIEQRIGRVHRFGQTSHVEIYTMPTKGTIDEYILYILSSKVNLFEMVIGELDTILSYMLKNDESFEVRIGRIVLESKTTMEIEENFRRIGEELLQAKEELASHVNLTSQFFDDLGAGKS